MKFFKKHKMDHGGLLYDNAGTITNTPELDKLQASRKMNRDHIGRIFAAFTRAKEQALAQLIREQK
jgi:ABC-type enterochelin transport system substrate-binding protein